MAFNDNNGLLSIRKYTQDTPDSLTYNPFTSDWQEEEEEALTATQVVYHNYDNVAHTEHSTVTPIRASQGAKESGSTHQGSRHTRAQTESYLFNYGGSGHLHPLRSAGMRAGPNDAGITRPHLSRIVNVGTLVDAPPVESDPSSKPTRRMEEKDVLVHEVRLNYSRLCRGLSYSQIESGDSLAGVSLKYGISMAELRRSNHLWSSDSIHMRKQLYIPLEKATRTQALQKDSILISISPAEELPDPLEDLEVSERQSSASNDLPYLGAGTIRRIPASHLSFFPPASATRSSAPARPSPYINQHTSPASHKPHLNHSRHASSPSHSLTSILTALPIAASTRDTIIARLSFDSVSSSYSDQEQVNDHHEGLELDDVQHAGSSNLPEHDYVNDEISLRHALPTPKVSHRVPRSDRSSVKSQSPSPTHVRTLSSSPHSYIPPHAQVRTIQLEPSPEMQVPSSKAPRQESQKGHNTLYASQVSS